MVVEDSLVIRGLIARILEADPKISVVTTVANGELALRALDRNDVEVVVLDIEMPVMDGMTALPLLIRKDPNLQIIMASTLTRKNAEISIRALAAGAAEYVAKPTTSREVNTAEEFRHDLTEKVLILGARRRQRVPASAGSARPVAAPRPVVPPAPAAALVLRPAQWLRPPTVVGIGSSTGGPQALLKVLGGLGPLRQPVLITQHMPATFTTILAEHIGRVATMPCAEAVDGEPVVGGRIYLAPGDNHMSVVARDGGRFIKLDQGPRINFCRPSVDPMLQSLSSVWRDGVLALILTGMGSDGLAGCRTVVEAGGKVIAQDEATSVVWGMPGAVARAGVCSEIVSISEIGPRLARIAGGAER
ncbi:MAG: chemotaxis response regulator protein-glutamate methylesterase [Alphaproteobacteria bacterium]